MAMVGAVSQPPTSGLMSQVHRLGAKVGSRLALADVLHSSCQLSTQAMTLSHDISTISK